MDRTTKLLATAAGVVFGLVLLVWFVLPRMLTSEPEADATPGIDLGKPTVADSLVRTTTPEAEPAEPGDPGGAVPLEPSPKRPQVVYGWVIEDDVRAFQAPGLNQPVVITLAYGQKVTWLEKAENWDRIRLKDGREAWVQNNQIAFSQPQDVEDTGPQEAVQAVQDFYAAINNRDYSTAYGLLSFGWKRDLSYARFAAGFARTQGARAKVERVETLSGDRIRVYVSLEVDEEDGRRTYVGSYVVEEFTGEWRLDEGLLQSAPGPARHSGWESAAREAPRGA